MEAPEPVVPVGLGVERGVHRLGRAEHGEHELRFVLDHPPVGGAALDAARVADLLLPLVDTEPFDGVGDPVTGGGRRQHGRIEPARSALAPDERSHQTEPEEDDGDRAEVSHPPRGPPLLSLPDAARDSIAASVGGVTRGSASGGRTARRHG
jgi:hypothetical protein